MTNIMALRVAPIGRVIAFEPHPDIYEELKDNSDCWVGTQGIESIVIHRVALSDRRGQGRLSIPTGFDRNRGLATLTSNDHILKQRRETFDVELGRLDDIVKSESIGMLKLDVEGHETNVLKGAQQLMKRRQICDIAFESGPHYPTPDTQLLEEQGYKVFELDISLFGLRVKTAGEHRRQIRRSVDAPSCLATLAPKRALSRLGKKGWSVLGRPPVNVLSVT